MKKFGKYLSIVILLLIGLCAVAGLYLFFVPGSHLFGLQYISINERLFSEAYDANSVNKIILNSYSYNTRVIAVSGDDISVMVYANNIGFVLKKNSAVAINPVIDGNTLTFNITEPHGATYAGESRVELRVPSTKVFDLKLINYKASTNVSAELNINDFTYNTSKGDLILNNATINGTLDLTLNNATATLGTELVTNDNNVILDIDSGKLNTTNHTLGNVSVEKNEKAVILLGNANSITMNSISSGGRIEANSVGNINIQSSDTNVYVQEVRDSAAIILTSSGKVNIDTLNTAALISTNTGDIKIGSSTSPLTLSSEHGDIDVLDTTSSVNASNKYGYINVIFNEDALSYSIDSISRKLIAKNENGKITCLGAENVDIKATNNSRVELTMNNVFDTNIIEGENGNVSVVISSEAIFLLDTSSSGNVSVNLSQISNVGTGGYSTGEYTETYINGSDGSNRLSISTTNGYLKIRDTITNQLG